MEVHAFLWKYFQSTVKKKGIFTFSELQFPGRGINSMVLCSAEGDVGYTASIFSLQQQIFS
jgi:hypothetical protein